MIRLFLSALHILLDFKCFFYYYYLFNHKCMILWTWHLVFLEAWLWKPQRNLTFSCMELTTLSRYSTAVLLYINWLCCFSCISADTVNIQYYVINTLTLTLLFLIIKIIQKVWGVFAYYFHLLIIINKVTLTSISVC